MEDEEEEKESRETPVNLACIYADVRSPRCLLLDLGERVSWIPAALKMNSLTKVIASSFVNNEVLIFNQLQFSVTHYSYTSF